MFYKMHITLYKSTKQCRPTSHIREHLFSLAIWFFHDFKYLRTDPYYYLIITKISINKKGGPMLLGSNEKTYTNSHDYY